MQNIRYIIVDDEPLAHEGIEILLKKYKNFICIGNFHDAFSAQIFLAEHTPDLIFMDLDMPDINGMDLLRNLPKKYNIIIVSGHTELALESYDVDVIDFLAKPIRPERLSLSIQKLINIINHNQIFESMKLELQEVKNHNTIDCIKVKSKCGNFISVSLVDIYFITKEQKYTIFNLKDKTKVEAEGSLEFYFNQLQSKDFIQVHRSYIVRIDAINKYYGNLLLLKNNESVEISKTYLSNVNERLRILGRD